MPPSTPRSLDAASLPALLSRLAHGPLLVALDFDGTLAPIVDRPDGARLEDPMHGHLSDLVELVVTAVVSGRDLEDLRLRVPTSGLILVGSHGVEIAYPGDGVERAPGLAESDAALGPLIRRLRHATAELPGVLVEPKRHSVAVHWRLAGPVEAVSAERVVDSLAGEFPAFVVGRGKMVAEFRPAIDRDKGSAIGLLRGHATVDGVPPAVLYLGDDVTDEDAFRALDPDRDTGILVAAPPRPSAAGWCLPDTRAVAGFLQSLIEARHAAAP
ncbi:trehalose-phosphatase [Thalassobaculum sp.]|uniref:trehalose-phosphatase n=1 Tax=Thalassobaculum sp. TaxID=2022740 RepID=UPI0032ECB70F